MNDWPITAASGDVTRLLNELQGGSRSAESQLLELVQHELHRIAERYMRLERANHTLQPTALVNEAYVRLLGDQIPVLKNRMHFFAVAANAMRRILIDYARAAKSGKRGGGLQRVDIESPFLFTTDNAEEMIFLDRALSGLASLDERQCRIVEMRFFAGMSEEEIGDALGLSVRTIRREWRIARAWLHAELTGGHARQSSA